jgi:acyl-CoA reductase-like NAD-dependent aldehyde dehydrogenase
MLDLPALGPRGPYRTRARRTLADVTGQPVAELSVVPPLFTHRTVSALRAAPPLPPNDRAAALAEAGHSFAKSTVDGMTPDEYDHAVSRVGGLPIREVRTARENIGARLARTAHSVGFARPVGAAADPRDVRRGAVWVRRGDVFAVHAAGNHPGTHSLWPAALALGYRVVVRPSRRDPFTPYRLISALRSAGFGDDRVAMLPTEHDTAASLLDTADLAMVYGGDDVIARYGGSPTVLPQGPGRSKILITRDTDWRAHLDVLVDSIAGHGGTGCVNATAVLVDGDAAALADALAGRLAALPSRPPEDEQAVLPVQPTSVARALESFLLARAEGTAPVLADVVADLGDGSSVLRPSVRLLDRADAPQAGIELPFPCVWVAPWSPADGLAPLRHTLALTVLTGDGRLVDDLLAEPTVGNVHVGDHPTHVVDPDLPHDDYLATFLMRAKTFIRTFSEEA